MVLVMPITIKILKSVSAKQIVRIHGPKAHLTKSGTPTMGGVAIVLTTLVMTFYVTMDAFFRYRGLHLKALFFLILATAGYGLLGFIDDYIKVVKRRNLGLTIQQKFLGQLTIGVALYWLLLLVHVNPGYHLQFALKIPFVTGAWSLGILYLPFLIFVLVGTANAVNFTDGLDGLLAGTSIIAYGSYALISFQQQQWELCCFALILVGVLLGFLCFNLHPAKVFMGDVGSLALGGGLAAFAILTKTELLLPVIGGIFVLEALSVIIQIYAFHFLGKRIFRMSPLHHHFELLGFSEWQTVLLFWSGSILFGLIGVLIYYYGYGAEFNVESLHSIGCGS
ncbi:MAG: hypothetical protein RLZ12_95 [Bacillota bacterium]|jgi:phospho-N-acetylmuramoyl-pentapeptide-transferase